MDGSEILWLGQPGCHNTQVVGGKVANLSQLAADYRVPPGFALTTAAFEEAMRSGIGCAVRIGGPFPSGAARTAERRLPEARRSLPDPRAQRRRALLCHRRGQQTVPQPGLHLCSRGHRPQQHGHVHPPAVSASPAGCQRWSVGAGNRTRAERFVGVDDTLVAPRRIPDRQVRAENTDGGGAGHADGRDDTDSAGGGRGHAPDPGGRTYPRRHRTRSRDPRPPEDVGGVGQQRRGRRRVGALFDQPLLG